MFSIRVVLSRGIRSIDYGIFEVSSASDFDTMRDHLYSIKGISRGRFWLTSLHYVDKPRFEEWKVIRIAINLLRCECYQDLLEAFEAEYENEFRIILRSTRARLLDRDVFHYMSSISAELVSNPKIYFSCKKRGLLAVFVSRSFGRGSVHGETIVEYDEVVKILSSIRPDVRLSSQDFLAMRLEDN